MGQVTRDPTIEGFLQALSERVANLERGSLFRTGEGVLKWAGTKRSGITLIKHELGRQPAIVLFTPIPLGAAVPSVGLSGVPSATEAGVTGELIVAATTEIAFYWLAA